LFLSFFLWYLFATLLSVLVPGEYFGHSSVLHVVQHNYFKFDLKTMSSSLSKEESLELSMENFNSVFRDKFREFALTCGAAGSIVISGNNITMLPPRRDMRVLRPILEADGVTPRLDVYGNPMFEEVPNGARVFSDDSRGDRLFFEYERKYQDLMEGKRKLIYKLLSSANTEVKSALTTSPGYQQLFDNYDILGMWQLTEQVCLGRGAISVYTMVVRTLKLKQEESYYQYQKDFKRMVVDLRAQGQPGDILQKIFNALFIMGLNQEQFRDKLTRVYGDQQWPDFEALSAELHTYAEATQRMSELRKDNNEGKIQANTVRANEAITSRRQCWNCGSVEHEKWVCDQPLHQCKKCGKSGHLEKFCRSQRPRGDATANRDERKPAAKKPAGNPREYQKKSTNQKYGKTSSRTRALKKIIAHLVDLDSDDDDYREDDQEMTSIPEEDNFIEECDDLDGDA